MGERTKVGVARVEAAVPASQGAFHGRWTVHIERQPNGFATSGSQPTWHDLPDDVRAGLLAWLVGENETAG